MNERIKELTEQANKDLDGAIPFGFAEKFAELIVQECAKIAVDTDLSDVEGGDGAVLRAAAAQIQEGFGL